MEALMNKFSKYPLVICYIAMENDPFIDGLPIKNGGSFHDYVSHNQRVYVYHHFWRKLSKMNGPFPVNIFKAWAAEMTTFLASYSEAARRGYPRFLGS